MPEYSEFVGVTREFTAGRNHAETALVDAVDYCIDNGILVDFLKKNRAKMLGILLEEFDAEKYKRTFRWEEREYSIRCVIEIL